MFRLMMKIGLSLFLTFICFRLIETPARIFLYLPQSRRIAYATFITVLAISVGIGYTIRKTQHVNATLNDVTNGGLVFSVKPGPASVVLMGDSNGSMYGKVIKKICEEIGENLAVISVDAGDPLPQRNGNSSKLWFDSLNVVRKIRPEYLVIANHWTEKLEDDRERLAVAIAELKPFVGHIVLLNQPPILPTEANRASFRSGVRPPFREVADVQLKRRAINAYLLQLQSQRVSVVDIASRFETLSGDILAIDGQGKWLYQDANHLSGLGADQVHMVLKQAFSLQ